MSSPKHSSEAPPILGTATADLRLGVANRLVLALGSDCVDHGFVVLDGLDGARDDDLVSGAPMPRN